jgi:hypothetical protein
MASDKAPIGTTGVREKPILGKDDKKGLYDDFVSYQSLESRTQRGQRIEKHGNSLHDIIETELKTLYEIDLNDKEATIATPNLHKFDKKKDADKLELAANSMIYKLAEQIITKSKHKSIWEGIEKLLKTPTGDKEHKGNLQQAYMMIREELEKFGIKYDDLVDQIKNSKNILQLAKNEEYQINSTMPAEKSQLYALIQNASAYMDKEYQTIGTLRQEFSRSQENRTDFVKAHNQTIKDTGFEYDHTHLGASEKDFQKALGDIANYLTTDEGNRKGILQEKSNYVEERNYVKKIDAKKK